MVSLCPWQVSMNGDSRPLCKHICDTIEVGEGIEVIGAMPYAEPPCVTILLQKPQGKIFRYKIRVQPAKTGEPSLQASTALAQLIMNNPLLLKGVTDFECSPTGSFIVFHGHKVDISPHFDGVTLQISAVVTEIIRKISVSTAATYVCSIGMVPITGNVAFLECEDTMDNHRFYQERNIRKWVSEHSTAPFNRQAVNEADIRIHTVAIPMNKQPSLPTKRKAVVTTKVPIKKVRTVSNKHVCAVWDRSGSMDSMGTAPLEGLQKLLRDQKAIAMSSGNPTKMSLYTFDNQMEVPVDNQDIAMVTIEDDWVAPRGTTRLYDTIVTAAIKLKEQVGDTESGVFIVMTDGVDNTSECDSETVRKTLESLPNNIECIFMAANVGDAQAVGQTMGFQRETSLTFTSEASDTAFKCMSQAALRSVTGGSAVFTRCERQSSVAPLAPKNVRTRTIF